MIDAEETKREKAKNLRYRKPIVKDLNLSSIQEEMWDISAECDNFRYYFDTDDDTLLNALDGNEEEEYEFKMMFADLCAECEQMQGDLQNEYVPLYFDEFFVSIGAGESGGGLLGWDSYEQDYFGIGISDSFAERESRKRMMRLKKEQLIEGAQACFKVVYAYLGIRHRYDCLKAAMDILRDENTGYLQLVNKINVTYERANEEGFYSWKQATRELEQLASAMPDLSWLQ